MEKSFYLKNLFEAHTIHECQEFNGRQPRLVENVSSKELWSTCNYLRTIIPTICFELSNSSSHNLQSPSESLSVLCKCCLKPQWPVYILVIMAESSCKHYEVIIRELHKICSSFINYVKLHLRTVDSSFVICSNFSYHDFVHPSQHSRPKLPRFAIRLQK